MFYASLKLLHVLAIVVWIGGMVFAHFFLRPAALQLPPPQRVPLMHAALQRFFAAAPVWVGGGRGSGPWGGWPAGPPQPSTPSSGWAAPPGTLLGPPPRPRRRRRPA